MSKLSKVPAIAGILLGMAVLASGWASINIALASIQNELGATILQLQWMMNLYGITICTALLPMGKLGDSFGRKWIFMMGLLGLAVACLGAGLARSPGFVIGFMALFGLSAAAVLSLSQALIVHEFHEHQKSLAIALWGTSTSIASSLGPLLGGTLIKYYSWRLVYLINVPLALISILLVLFFVKREESGSSHCDWKGIGLLSAFAAVTVTAILQGPTWGFDSWKIIGLFTLASAIFIVFIITERNSSEKLFHPSLFAHRGFIFASICNACLMGVVWATFFFVPLYLQNEMEISSLQTGLKMLFLTTPVAALSYIVSRYYEKIGARAPLSLGFMVIFIAVFFQSLLTIEGSCLLIGLGWALTLSPAASSALSSLPHKMAGIASGMYLTLEEFGAVLILAVAGVTFRMGTNRFLAPKMGEIEAVLKDRTVSLISDPRGAEKFVEPNSPVLAWLHQGFEVGYHDVLLFLSLLMAAALVCACFVPKKKVKVLN